MTTTTLGLLAAAATLALSLTACGDDDSDSAEDGGSTDDVSCTYTPAEPTADVTTPPSSAPSEGARTVTLATTIGEVDLELDAAKAPCTVNSFVSLVEQGFFDGTTCHRLTTAESGIYVLQCGDPGNGPYGPGTGGPGYNVVDEFPDASDFGPGTLAMAKTPDPDTSGSQFFIIYDGPDDQLPPEYNIFGEVTTGLDAIQEAAAAGTQADGVTPATDVTIDTATVD